MNILEWTKKARKQIVSLPNKELERIFEAVESLSNWPDVRNVKALTNRNDYRLRVGRYRILFTVQPNGTVTIITIEEVKKRDEHTY